MCSTIELQAVTVCVPSDTYPQHIDCSRLFKHRDQLGEESPYPCLSSLVDVTFTTLQDHAVLVNCILCDVCHMFISTDQQHLSLTHTVGVARLTDPFTDEPSYQIP